HPHFSAKDSAKSPSGKAKKRQGKWFRGRQKEPWEKPGLASLLAGAGGQGTPGHVMNAFVIISAPSDDATRADWKRFFLPEEPTAGTARIRVRPGPPAKDRLADLQRAGAGGLQLLHPVQPGDSATRAARFEDRCCFVDDRKQF